MTKQEAIAMVAHNAAGIIAGSDLSEATGLMPGDIDAMSDADATRLWWACGEVEARLYRMGKGGKS